MLLSDRKCNTKIFHRNWKVKELSVRKTSAKRDKVTKQHLLLSKVAVLSLSKLDADFT